PVLLQDGQPFPFRNLILFITFIVILVTLVFQGLTLPWIIRKLHPTGYNELPEHEQEIIIQKKIAKYSLQFIEDNYGNDALQNEHVSNLQARLKIDFAFLDREIAEITDTKENSHISFQRIYLEMLEHQRNLLDQMNHKAEFDEELIRKYLSLIDIEEFKIREKLLQVKELN